MRRPFLALACAIVLQLALLQGALAGDSPAGPAAVAASATTTAQNPGRHLGWCDPQPPNGKDVKGHRHCSTTPTPPPTPPPTPTPTKNTTPQGRGTFTREPASGPVGTIIHFASVTPSPLSGDQIAIVALVKGDPSTVQVVTVSVSNSGSWQGTLVVPSNAAVGDYELMASTQSVGGGDEFHYTPLPFNVVPAPPGGGGPPGAPTRQLSPVPPVVKPPTLTG